MAIRIRVYPQYANGLGGLGGYNRLGAVSVSTLYNHKLSAQKQVSSLQIQYERALANEKIERARLEERMRFAPYAAGGYGAYPVQAAYGYANPMIGASLLGGQSMFGGLGLGRFW